jgi:hypothetical protein
MRSRSLVELALAAVVTAAVWGPSMVNRWNAASAAPEVVDPTYGDLHHIYMFSAGGDEIWHKSTKNSGPITGLGGKVLPSTPDSAHPGCLNVFVKVIPGVDQGIKWTTTDKDPEVISSASENMRVIACHDAVLQYESVDD